MPYRNRETRKEYFREYNRKNREKLRAKVSAWRQANPDKVKLQNKRRWLKLRVNPHYKEDRRKYVEKHRERINEYSRMSRRKQNLRKEQLIKFIFGSKCQRCGFETEVFAVFELHHIGEKKEYRSRDRLSYARLEKHISENKDDLRLLCSNCHRIIHYYLSHQILSNPYNRRK